MRQLITAGLLALLLPLSAAAMEFKEGVHYEVISDNETKKPELTEYFSFYCPHCKNFEPVIAKLKPMLDKSVKFKKSHVDFVGPRDKETQTLMAQALAAADVLPQKTQLIGAIFEHIHSKRASFNGVADVKDVFSQQGVEAGKFDKYYNSFSVRTLASKMKRDQDKLQGKGALNSVPTFIVNGKYKLLLGRESGLTDPKDISALVNHLAAR